MGRALCRLDQRGQLTVSHDLLPSVVTLTVWPSGVTEVALRESCL